MAWMLFQKGEGSEALVQEVVPAGLVCVCWGWGDGWGDTMEPALWASLMATAVECLNPAACRPPPLLFESCLRAEKAVS